jgi:flagellar motor component MotA
MIIKFLGAVIFGAALWLLYRFEQADMAAGFQLFFWPAMLVTFVGPIGLLLFSTDLEQIQSVLGFFFHESIGRSRRHLDQEYTLLRRLGGEFYARGPRAFEVKGPEISIHISRMLERLSIRIPMVDAFDMLERDRDQVADRIEQGISMVTLGGRLAPSVGMLGTIIGMSQLLSHLKDPENIGASMSVALLTTFYGLFFSLALWTPLQNHLHRLLDLKMRSFDQALHWLDLMQKRKPADYMGDHETRSSPDSPASSNAVSLAGHTP